MAKVTGSRGQKGHGRNEGGQPKPSGNCHLDEWHTQPMRRKELRVGVWNVTGCRSRECELEDALKGYKLDVLGLSETWLRKGEEIAIPGYKWVGVAGEKASGKGGGIGFMVKDAIWELVGQVREVNSRIIGMFMRIGKTNCWILQVYAPINDACSEDRERFWMTLRDEVEERRKVLVL